MLFDFRKIIICILAPSFVSALPRPQPSTTTTTAAAASSSAAATSLPESLQSLIPSCAQACLEDILSTQFPLSCSTSGDLDCLCDQYSSTGLTLGEAAYGCAVTSCPSSTSNITNTYSICSGISGAVAATHSTLTFTAHITATSKSSTTSISSTSATSSHDVKASTRSRTVDVTTVVSAQAARTYLSSSTSSDTSQQSKPTSTTAASSAATVTSTSTFYSSSTSIPSASASDTTSSTSTSGSGLTTSQIIGISVASVSAVTLAVGAILLCTCLRRRDKRDQEEDKLEKPLFALTPPSHHEPTAYDHFPIPPRPGKDPRLGVGGVGIVQVQRDPDRNLGQAHERPKTPPEAIGVALSPETDSPIASPVSIASTRTVSQLLPDKPAPVYTRPLPPKRPLRPESTMSQMTEFEEDTAVRRSLHPVRAVQVPLPLPPIVPPRSQYRPPPQFAQYYTTSPEEVRQPQLSLQIPSSGSSYVPFPTPSPPPYPSPLRIPRNRPAGPSAPLPQMRLTPLPVANAHSSSASSTAHTSSNSSNSYIPAYYTSPSSIVQTPPSIYYGPGASASHDRNLIQPQGSQAIALPPRFRLNRSSSASVTSFESAFADDPSPPEDTETENKQLDASPISDLRYPKIPRASNQAVPRTRSPKGRAEEKHAQGERQAHGLLARRIGENRAEELGRGLRIQGSFGSQVGDLHSSGGESVESGALGRVEKKRLRESMQQWNRSSVQAPAAAFDSGSTGDVQIKTPLWAPRLTPTKKGEDLYISVAYSTR